MTTNVAPPPSPHDDYQRMSTTVQELIATEIHNDDDDGKQRRGGSLLLVPTMQGDNEENSSVESSLSTADLDEGEAESLSDDENEQQEVILTLQQQDDEKEDTQQQQQQRSMFVLRLARSLKRQHEKRCPTTTSQQQQQSHQHRRQLLKEVVDVESYMASREMTATQERWNALTILPSPIYCLYFLLSGIWVNVDVDADDDVAQQNDATLSYYLYNYFGDHGCLSISYADQDFYWWQCMPALPPLPVLAVAMGICLHAPWSFLYHWCYAHRLAPGLPRTTHWSRRMDHVMIHVASALISFGTSGSWDYFLVNALYNLDCVYRQLFEQQVKPRRNKIRIAISILAYTLPILRRGELELFCQLWFIFGVSGWLFAKYPIGGWSHSAFHLVIALAPPLMMRAACQLPASQQQLRLAAECAAAAQNV